MLFDRFFTSYGPKFTPSGPRKIKPVMLLVLDGWGIAPPSRGNVITQAKLTNLEHLFATYPHAELIAAGESVGLPANEVGNTEVGHLTLGSGRVTYQGLKRINMSIEDGSFFRNPAFRKVIQHVKDNQSKLHILGVLTSGNVHGSLPHFYALLEMCKQNGLPNVFVHAFTDGRDAPPQASETLFPQIEEKMKALQIGEFATVSGRYYAMDRDRRWERVEKAYQVIAQGVGQTANSYQEVLQATHQKGVSDELIEPTVIMKNGQPTATIDDNDGVIFFNFRIDRPRELTMAFTMPDFENMDIAQFGYTDTENRQHAKTLREGRPFNRQKKVQNLCFVTMTNYHKNIPVQAIAFDTPILDCPIGQVISEAGMIQLRMAESEKERFVGYYVDGHHEEVFPGTETHIIPSPKVPTYDKKPEMSVAKLVTEFKKHLSEDRHQFFVMNIANPDMVAHTGNIAATIKACQATDKAVGEIAQAILACEGTLFLTADHGNAEELLTYPTSSFFFTTSQGTMNTDHSNNPVPLLVVGKEFEGRQQLPMGSLSDVAPTILHYMNLPVPPVMTGKNLLQAPE